MSIKELLTRIINALKVDYIVEEGTSGIWTYRKWNSGVAECWGRTEQMTRSFTNTLGNGYYAPKFTANYPTGLFVTPPTTNLTMHDGGAVLGWVATSTNGINGVEGYPSSVIRVENKTIYININAKGLWKQLGGVIRDYLLTLSGRGCLLCQ